MAVQRAVTIVSGQLQDIPSTDELQVGDGVAPNTPGAGIRYTDKTIIPTVAATVNFTFGAANETRREIQVAGLVGTLNHLDDVGTTYEFAALGGLANPNLTLTPDGAATISGPGASTQATIVVNVTNMWRSITKQSDGNWLLSGA